MRTPASDRLCSLLHCRLPIVSAGMGGPARSELVSAVSAAGGFGFLGMVREPVELIRREVEAVRRAGHRHFGVNLIPFSTPPELLAQQIALCVEISVPVVCMFWDLDQSAVAMLKDAGILVAWQVGSVEEARDAERAGVDIIIAQGVEAGGHVRGTQRLGVLLPDVVEAVKVPVLAAGGLASGGDLITALALGAGGVMLGTALLASQESFAHEYHKQRLVGARPEETHLTEKFHINWPPGAAVRVLSGPWIDAVEGGGGEVIAQDDGRPLVRFTTDSPLRTTAGALEQMALYAGTGVGDVRAIDPAGAIIRRIYDTASHLVDLDAHETASPVCYLPQELPSPGTGAADDVALKVDEISAGLRLALRQHLREHTSLHASPPFDAAARDFARWSMLLGAHLAALVAPADASLLERERALLSQVEAVLPRMNSSQLKEQLVRLQAFLAERRPGRWQQNLNPRN